MPSAASAPPNSRSLSARISVSSATSVPSPAWCSSGLVAATAPGAPARMPATSWLTVVRHVVGDVRDQTHVAGGDGVERLAGQERRGELRPRAAAQDGHAR